MEFILGMVLGFLIASSKKTRGYRPVGSRKCQTTAISTVTKKLPNITSGIK